MRETRPDATSGDRTLAVISERVSEAVTAAAKAYDSVRAAKDLGYSDVELWRATGFTREVLDDVMQGKNPPLAVDRALPQAPVVDSGVTVGADAPQPSRRPVRAPQSSPAKPEQHGERLTLSVVEDLKRKGFNQSEIAQMYGVTKQYVSWIKHNYGGSLTPREIVLKTFPWSVPDRMTQSTLYKRLRDHGEYMATRGEGMADSKLTRLRSFYRRLRTDNLVVVFDPNHPPEPGVSAVGGFTYRRRTPDDGRLLIRVDSGTELTDEQQKIWCFPDVEP